MRERVRESEIERASERASERERRERNPFAKRCLVEDTLG